jgi:hypothetical protein
MSPSTDMNTVEKRNIPLPARNRTPIFLPASSDQDTDATGLKGFDPQFSISIATYRNAEKSS